MHSIFLIQILAPRQMARPGDQQMNFCMHSCTFTRDSITTFTLHITCTVHPGLDNIGLVSWVQRCHPFSFGHYASSAWCIMKSCLLSFLCNPYIHFIIYYLLVIIACTIMIIVTAKHTNHHNSFLSATDQK